jgi:hypothetical protein
VFAKTRSFAWPTLAGAGGGLFVGAFGKMLGHDAFSLIVGRSPGDITGAMEGLLVGAAVGLSSLVAAQRRSLRRALALSAGIGAVAGLAIALLGGRLMFGSLELLAAAFPGSRLRLDELASLGSAAGTVTTVVEAALFSAGVVGAMTIARRRFGGS